MNLELCPICGNLPESERATFYQKLKAVTKTYAKDDFIAHPRRYGELALPFIERERKDRNDHGEWGSIGG